MKKKLKLGVLVSGNGSNLEAILKACQKPSFPARVVVVISNNPEAFALQRARKYGIPTVVVAKNNEAEILAALKKSKVDLVCLAGFMKMLSAGFIKKYRHRIINIHPSLLPSFPGLHAQRQALEHGVKITGATVHFVDAGCDTGPIILQGAVPVLENDTLEKLKRRILKVEHKIYIEGLKVIGRRVIKTGRKK
ncbi:MAG: phosphoribosylglycinamide formyltransferase [Deltaproteobacteria bacterium]|nr:phosphoribosylglycinamide formyltransferase [Deltaproteobacteria bacterium]